MQEEYEEKIAKLQEEHEEALREAKGSKTVVSMNSMNGEQEVMWHDSYALTPKSD